MSCAIAPAHGRISSPYGWRQFDSGPDLHTGIDIIGKRGTPIFAALPGKVIVAAPTGKISGYGNVVIVYHPDEDLYSLYAHMDSFKTREGAIVQRGQQVGKMGSTGGTREDPNHQVPVHLHFEVLTQWPPQGKDLNRLNPQEVLADFGVILDDDRALASICSGSPKFLVATLFEHIVRPLPRIFS